MTSKKVFLNKTYNAYANREIPEEDVELTHVGPGTPGGEYLRRFWHPVIYIEELTDVPVATRILGEDLVVFQDFGGQLGAVAVLPIGDRLLLREHRTQPGTLDGYCRDLRLR